MTAVQAWFREPEPEEPTGDPRDDSLPWAESYRNGSKMTARSHFFNLWNGRDSIDRRHQEALDSLTSWRTQLEGETGPPQAPWPDVDGAAHASVHVNVDGSKYSDPTAAGAGVVIFPEGGKRRRSQLAWHPPILETGYRVAGTQLSNRAELLAAFIGLRACRSVPKVSMFTDSEFVEKLVERYWRDGIHTATQNTAGGHLDILSKLISELKLRDGQYPSGHFRLTGVRSHCDDTPIEHVHVDLTAKRAAVVLDESDPDDPVPIAPRLLPQHWPKLLSGYSIICNHQTHNHVELRRLLLQRIRQRDAAELSQTHLRHLVQPDLEHGLSMKVWLETHADRAKLHEQFLRLKFGVCRVHTTFSAVGHTCAHCQQLVRDAHGTPIHISKLHGTDYISHCLFDCPAIHFLTLRAALNAQYSSFTIKQRAKDCAFVVPNFCMSNAVDDALLQRARPNTELAVDPRGFYAVGTSAALKVAGMSVIDLVRLHRCCAPILDSILEIAVFGPPPPVLPNVQV